MRRLSPRLTPSLLLLLVAACASGGSSEAPDADVNAVDGGMDAAEGPLDGGPELPADGGPPDADEDGVPDAIDCDLADPEVGALAERACESDCAAGVERCEEGVWRPCTAPTDCECSPGDEPREVECERCGVQTQVCADGGWVDEGECAAGACSPGDEETGGACGECGMEKRTCGDDCTWGEWTCAEDGVCSPGEMDTETESCGACMEGTRSRTRTCGDGCGWGDFGEWSTCEGTGCAPGETRPCDNRDDCGHEVCQDDCTWGECEPIDECLYIRPGTSTGGNHYRCCGDGQWQFCLSSCKWSTDCAACESCSC